MWVIYCSQQLDGIAAAAIILRYARLKNTKCRIAGFLEYVKIEEKFQEIQKHKNDLIFILDFSPEQIHNFEDKLKKISQNNKIAYWNCHHPYNAKTVNIMMKYVHSIDFSGAMKKTGKKEQKLCSADMACNKFLPRDNTAQKLRHLAHDIEFWINSDVTAIKLADLIQSGFDKKELAQIFSRGVFWSERFEKIREQYLDKKTTALNNLMKKIIIIKYLNIRFGFALAPIILSSADAGQKMLDSHSGIDAAAVLFRNGKISFRKRNNTPVDLSKIAELFDGGGHHYASGGKINKKISSGNLEKVIFQIDRTLKNFFLNS